MKILLLSLLSLNLFAQSADLVTVMTSNRVLVSHGDCDKVVWSNYGKELDYAQVNVDMKYCQEFATYQNPPVVPGSTKNATKWKGKATPDQGAVLKGHHFELISEKEIFVLT